MFMPNPNQPLDHYAQVNPHNLNIEIYYYVRKGDGPMQPDHIKVPDEIPDKSNAGFLKAIRNEAGEIVIIQRVD